MSDQDEMLVRVMGRALGTASGWDRIDDDILFFYDFKPSIDALKPLGGGFAVDLERGLFIRYDDDGAEAAVLDAVPILAGLPQESEQ